MSLCDYMSLNFKGDNSCKENMLPNMPTRCKLQLILEKFLSLFSIMMESCDIFCSNEKYIYPPFIVIYPSKEREICFGQGKRDKVVNSTARKRLPRCCRGDFTWLYLQSPSSSFPFSHRDTLTRATFHHLESKGDLFLPQLVQELGF